MTTSTSIRNIRRNISEAATGVRCNRYDRKRNGHSFKSHREAINSYIRGLLKVEEYEKHHKVHTH